MVTFSDLLQKTNYLDEKGRHLISKAYQKVEGLHKGVFRKSGEPFVQHLLGVSLNLSGMKMDEETLAAALLHHTPKLNGINPKGLSYEFGENVAEMVNAVNLLHRIKLPKHRNYEELNERQIEIFRKVFIVIAKDPRVIIIKMADRWDDLKTLSVLPVEKQKRIAYETLKIYSPVASYLGMEGIKGQLEDLAFSYTHPKEYAALSGLVLPEYQSRERYILKIKKILEDELERVGLKASVHGRAKRLYSLYKKLQKYDYDINKIYDLIALRVIVSNISDCYTVLSLIHKKWKPLSGKIKDYIVAPKPNGYQSLHTTVICVDGQMVEFQIRTKKMHEKAEYGIAAHWHYTQQVRPKEYKEGAIRSEQDTKVPTHKLEWVNKLLTWQRELKKSKDYIKQMGENLFKNRIFIFTPKDDIIDLPKDATPIDFAYHIHSEIGNHTAGAKVDGKMVPLNTPLKNGSTVEILTSKDAKPSLDWLKYIKTAKAREKIKSQLKSSFN